MQVLNEGEGILLNIAVDALLQSFQKGGAVEIDDFFFRLVVDLFKKFGLLLGSNHRIVKQLWVVLLSDHHEVEAAPTRFAAPQLHFFIGSCLLVHIGTKSLPIFKVGFLFKLFLELLEKFIRLGRG